MFNNLRTGVLVTRNQKQAGSSQFAASDFLEETQSQTTVSIFDGLVFLEPLDSSTSLALLQEFGVEKGSLYRAYFDKNSSIAEFDTISWNPSNLEQNVVFNPALPVKKGHIRKLVQGLGSIGKLEATILVS